MKLRSNYEEKKSCRLVGSVIITSSIIKAFGMLLDFRAVKYGKL